MLGVLAKIRGVLPALRHFLDLPFSKYATASIRALALPLEKHSLLHVLPLEAILKSGMEQTTSFYDEIKTTKNDVLNSLCKYVNFMLLPC